MKKVKGTKLTLNGKELNSKNLELTEEEIKEKLESISERVNERYADVFRKLVEQGD